MKRTLQIHVSTVFLSQPLATAWIDVDMIVSKINSFLAFISNA